MLHIPTITITRTAIPAAMMIRIFMSFLHITTKSCQLCSTSLVGHRERLTTTTRTQRNCQLVASLRTETIIVSSPSVSALYSLLVGILEPGRPGCLPRQIMSATFAEETPPSPQVPVLSPASSKSTNQSCPAAHLNARLALQS